MVTMFPKKLGQCFLMKKLPKVPTLIYQFEFIGKVISSQIAASNIKELEPETNIVSHDLAEDSHFWMMRT